VVDTKSVMQFALNSIEQNILEIAVWFYQVSGECNFGLGTANESRLLLRKGRGTANATSFNEISKKEAVMKNVLRSTFGTLVVAAFLAITPPMYARGGHGGGHDGHRGGHGGHVVRHAAVGHVKGGHVGFRVRGGRGQHFAGHGRGYARYTGRGYYATRGGYWGGNGHWGGSSWYPYYGYSRFGYYGLGYSYPYYGYYGYRSGWCYDPYYGYHPCGYYPYRYGYWPYLSFSFGGY